MIKVFLGDRIKVKAAADKYLKSEEVIFFDENSPVESIEPLIGTTSLFGKKFFVRFDGVWGNESLQKLILKNLEALNKSANSFALIEEKINSDGTLAFEEAGVEIERFLGEKKERPPFNIFSLSDSLSSRDKKDLWVKFTEAIESGETPEAIAGVFFWQLKTILLTKAGDVAGLNPFVVSKARKALEKYTEDELKELTFRLVSLYHDAHRGKVDLSEALERTILSL